MPKSPLLLLLAVTACVDDPLESALEQHADPPPAPPCKIDPTTNDAQTASPAKPLIERALATWVGDRCPPGMVPTPRDVTCHFKSKLTEVSATKAMHINDGVTTGAEGTLTTSCYDAAGKLLGSEDTPITLDDKASCVAICGGTIASTLATGEVTGATAAGVPPAVIPPANETPQGKSFCEAYQGLLKTHAADCALGNATTTWWGDIGQINIDWIKDGKPTEEKSESKVDGTDKYPTCVRRVYVAKVQKYKLDEKAEDKKCQAILDAMPAADVEAVCRKSARLDSFSSTVSGAAVCITKPGGPGNPDDDGDGDSGSDADPTPDEPTGDVITR